MSIQEEALAAGIAIGKAIKIKHDVEKLFKGSPVLVLTRDEWEHLIPFLALGIETKYHQDKAKYGHVEVAR